MRKSLDENKDLSIIKTSRRLSVASNGSMISDVHIEVLTELAKSVKGLNQRLIKSEEVTYDRLKENLKLKEKIKVLETKIGEQKGSKIESTGKNTGCTGGQCFLF
jgi:hypothetical protein